MDLWSGRKHPEGKQGTGVPSLICYCGSANASHWQGQAAVLGSKWAVARAGMEGYEPSPPGLEMNALGGKTSPFVTTHSQLILSEIICALKDKDFIMSRVAYWDRCFSLAQFEVVVMLYGEGFQVVSLGD